VQPVLSDCNGNNQVYDDNTGVIDSGTGNQLPNSGLLAINKHPATSPTVNSGDPPQIDTGGVTVSGSCPNATQYFAQSGADCNVVVDASVKFASDVTGNGNNNPAIVFLTQHEWDPVNSTWITTKTQMNPPGGNGANACPATLYCLPITILDTSGIDQLSLSWEEDAGKIGATTCGNGKGNNPPPCTGVFENGAILQQVFGACDGCNQPDDSGPIIFARVTQNGGADANTMAPGSQSNVVFTLKLAGLNTAQWLPPTAQIPFNPPPTVLRFSVTANHTTGLVDCGQGNGAGQNGDAATVYYGCGPQNPQFTPPLPSLVVNTRNSCNPIPGASPWDCVKTTAGQRRNVIVCSLVQRITGQPFSSNCSNNGGTCPANNWNPYQGHPPGDDPRAVTMILTSDLDLAGAAGSPQVWLPIYQFATFYVVGWDTGVSPSCTGPGPGQNAPFPTKGKKNQQNGSIWGYWINYTTFGTPNGQPCPINSQQPVNCVPALTR